MIVVVNAQKIVDDLLFRHKSLLFYTFPFPDLEKQHFQLLLIDVQVMTWLFQAFY